MRRNWYAILLLLVLALLLGCSANYVRQTSDQMRRGVDAAYACTLTQDYDGARRAYQAAVRLGEQHALRLRLVVRRTLVDKVEETMAVLPCYATPDNQADLAVETARAKALIDQMEASFFGGA